MIRWEPLQLILPRVTINTKNGTIFINKAACDLIPRIDDYRYVQPLKPAGDPSISVLGLQFMTTKTDDTYSAYHNRSGILLMSKLLVQALSLGVVGESHAFAAEKYDDVTLAIPLTQPSSDPSLD